MKFASPQWCDSFKKALNDDKNLTSWFTDAPNFNYKFEIFAEGSGSFHLYFKKAMVDYCGPPQGDVEFVLGADVDTWKKIASGSDPASKLFTLGKVKVTKGPLDIIIKNVVALDNVCGKVGLIGTEW